MTIQTPYIIDTTQIEDGQAPGSIVPGRIRIITDSLSGIATSTTQTTSYTLAFTDHGAMVEYNSPVPGSFTIPLNAAVNYDVGTEIEYCQRGTGALTIVAAFGVTLLIPPNLSATTYGQGAQGRIRQTATDVWVLSGNQATSPYPVQTGAYFVSPTGSDTLGDGTLNKPWATIQKARIAMQTGYKLTYLRGGIYTVGPLTTTLNGNITTTGVTSVVVTNAAAIVPNVSALPVTIQVNTENMSVTGIATNTLTVTRGFNGSTAATHTSGATVNLGAIFQLNAAGDANTTYCNYPGESPIIDGGNAIVSIFSVEENGVTFRGITFRNLASTLAISTWNRAYMNAAAVMAYPPNGTVTGTKISNCTAFSINSTSDDTHNAAFVAIGISGSVLFTGFEVSNCLVYNCGSAGISTLGPGSQVWITDNIVHDCVQSTGAGADNGSIYSFDSTNTSMVWMCLRNIIYNAGAGAAPQVSETYLLYMDFGISNNLWFGNWAYGACGHPIHQHGSARAEFHNNVFDITNAFNVNYYQGGTGGGALTMSGNVFSNNIVYTGSATQPIATDGGGPASELWDIDFTSGTVALPTVVGNLHYAPSVSGGILANTGYRDDLSTTINPLDTSVTNGNPLFQNVGASNYYPSAGSPAFSLAGPYLPVVPGTGPNQLGLPPTWAALANNIIRNPDPTVGSVLATSAGGAMPTGGTMPTNWSFTSLAGLTSSVFYTGKRSDGLPTIRLRLTGTTSGTSVILQFDSTAPAAAAVTYAHHIAGLSVCAGSMANITAVAVTNIANPSSTTLSSSAVTVTGIPTPVVTPLTATPGATTSISSSLRLTVTNSAAVDVTFEISAVQISS